MKRLSSLIRKVFPHDIDDPKCEHCRFFGGEECNSSLHKGGPVKHELMRIKNRHGDCKDFEQLGVSWWIPVITLLIIIAVALKLIGVI
jgi:hypothetical protein